MFFKGIKGFEQKVGEKRARDLLRAKRVQVIIKVVLTY